MFISVWLFPPNVMFNWLFKLVHATACSFYFYIGFHCLIYHSLFSILFFKCWVDFWLWLLWTYLLVQTYKHFSWVYTEEWNLPNLLWKCIFIYFPSIRLLLFSSPLVMSLPESLQNFLTQVESWPSPSAHLFNTVPLLKSDPETSGGSPLTVLKVFQHPTLTNPLASTKLYILLHILFINHTIFL